MTIILPRPLAEALAGETTPGHRIEPRALKDWTFGISDHVLADAAHASKHSDLAEVTTRNVESSEWGSGIGTPPSAASNPQLPGMFTHGDVARLSFRVAMNARPPTTDTESATTYAYWPLTEVDTESILEVQPNKTTWTGKNWHRLWGMRSCVVGPYNYRANRIAMPIRFGENNAIEGRVEYTTLAKAEAAMKAQALWTLGSELSEAEAIAAAAGMSVVTRATMAAAPENYFTDDALFAALGWKVARDIIWLTEARIADAANGEGIVLDCEFQDGRSAAETVALIEWLADRCHAVQKKLWLFCNPLNTASAANSGIDADSIPDLHAAADFISILLWGGAAEGKNNPTQAFDNQVALLGGSPNFGKVAVTCGLGVYPNELPVAACETINGLMTANSIPIMNIWRNYAAQGGVDDTNSQLSALFGFS